MAQLNFKGKQFVQNYHLTVKYHELIPQKEKSLTNKVILNDNLIIHGDNLKALKALLPNYAGKIKCIYIDPPYNTGNENWVYNDNVNSPMIKEWLGKVVDKEDLTRHDKWLCMMTPRLKLLRELLRDDGAIFISIDDNEQHNLKMLMEEVFSGSFIGQFPWKGKSGAEDDTYYRTVHEYILCYAKDKNLFNPGLQEKIDEKFPKFDPIRNKNYKTQLARKWGSNSKRGDRPKLYYPITAPDESQVYPKLPNGEDGCWRWSAKKMQVEIDDGKVEFTKENGIWNVYEKIYEPTKEEGPLTKKFNSWLDDVGSTSNGTDELKEIFGQAVFDHPKPTALITKLLLMAGVKDKDIVLDSFSGSGTTAQAVLTLNKEYGGNREFILIECEDYADAITAERIRRVTKGVPNAKDENLRKGLGGGFSFFDLGKEIEMETILSGKNLPTYKELARYVFYTATGEEFDEKAVNENKNFIGESKEYEIYLFYKPDLNYLKNTALTLDGAKALGPYKNKKRLVFAPTKYLDQEFLDQLKVDFAQLPFEIYKLSK